MEAALEVFASEGYHQASISKIARHAGISKGLLYNYFESKEQLLMETLTEGIERIHGVFKQMEDEMDTPEELMILIKGSFDIVNRDPHFFKLMFTVLFQPDVYTMARSKYEKVVGSLMQDIAYYFKQKGDPYPMEKALVLGATLDGVGMHYMMAPEGFNLERIEKIIFDLFK